MATRKRKEWTKKDSKIRAARRARADDPRAPTAWGLSRRFKLRPIAIVEAGDERLARLRSERWTLEVAWDGHRVLACRVGDDVRIVSPDWREWSDAFPAVTLALLQLPVQNVAIEGFICALDDGARPSFERLRECVEKKEGAVLFAMTDLFQIDGVDVTNRPANERRAHLAKLASPVLTYSEPLAGDLEVVLDAMEKHGVPGVLARSEDGSETIAIPCDGVEIDWARSLSPSPKVTNAEKVLFPRDAITKSEIVAFYKDIAPVLLPLMKDRPIVCQRWPDGVDEFTWYQHRLPPRAPDYLRGVWIDGNRRIVIETVDALAWMANQAALTFHGWASRLESLEQPDWMVIDLDPGTKTTWEQTIEVAIALRKLLELLELSSVPKTSGQRGIHVLIPLRPGHNPKQAHHVAQQIALLLCKLLPELVSIDAEIEKRGGRLYLDHQQSFVGKSLVLPYSLRAVDGAPVSMPLDWSEIQKGLDPTSFNLKTLRQRLDAKGDMAAPLFAPAEKRGDLKAVLARLNG